MCDDKVLLVTGASSDVGYELIKRVSSNYSKVWAHYRSSSEIIDRMQSEFGDRIVPLQADFSDLASTEELIGIIKSSTYYPDHIVHLSAQRAYNLQFHKHSWESFQKEIDTSLRSIMMILQEFIPKMSKEKYGRIVFMLSAYIIGVPPKFQSSYITVKYALLGLMRALAAEYASKGITVNAVSPDMMETKFLSNLPDLVKEQSANNNPLGRNLCVDEIVPTIEYLLSPGSVVVTGQNIGVTGGGR